MSSSICRSCRASRGILSFCTENVVFQSQARHYTNLKDEKLKQIRDRIIRVDHAGEYGANRIYAGQMAVLGAFKKYVKEITTKASMWIKQFPNSIYKFYYCRKHQIRSTNSAHVGSGKGTFANL